MRIFNTIKTYTLAASLAAAPLCVTKTYSQPKEFYISNNIYEKYIKPQGIVDKRILSCAPSPKIEVAGKKEIAGIVVDTKRNILYRYDDLGVPINAYLIASGKESTPTPTGLRIVTHVEKYPYSTAPKRTKRRRYPRDYGKYVVCLNIVDPNTGAQRTTSVFIHGCKSYYQTFEAVPSRRVSHGCIRMAEEGIEEVKNVKPGTYVRID